MRTAWVVFCTVFLAAASAVTAEPLLATGPSVEVSPSGDRVIVRWGDLPAEAVEQEVLISIDGGRNWAEIARPTSIDVRRIEVGLPRGVDALVRFAVRAGDQLRELGEAESAPLELLAAREPEDSVMVIAGWRSGERPQADPGQGSELPPVLEPGQDKRLERLPKSKSPLQDGDGSPPVGRFGTGTTMSIPSIDPNASPFEFPLQN